MALGEFFCNPTFLLTLSRHSEPKAKNLDGGDIESLRFAQGDGRGSYFAFVHLSSMTLSSVSTGKLGLFVLLAD